MKKFKKAKGFTLAEVLITLGIIGVVAALTIPILISNYQKSQYVTQLKKVYTEINQALLQMTTEAGCPNDLEAAGLVGSGTSWASFGDALTTHMKVSKNCRTTANLGCWTTKTMSHYDGTGGVSNYDSDTRYAFITMDGMSIYADNGGGCGDYGTGKTGNMSRYCGSMIIDVNGPTKGPNFAGRDTFYLYITNGHGAVLYPSGGEDDGIAWVGSWKNAAGNPRFCYPGDTDGTRCSGRIIEEGWQMKY